MKKTPSLFVRDWHGERQYTPVVTPGAEWVTRGEGVATRKVDGTCCLVQGGALLRRFDAKTGRRVPPDFLPAQPEPDPVTGHWPGWVPVTDADPQAKYHREAWAAAGGTLADGTYELLGPKVQGGADADLHRGAHTLVRHDALILDGVPRDFEGLRAYLTANLPREGVVFHHPDGRLVKVRAGAFLPGSGRKGRRAAEPAPA